MPCPARRRASGRLENWGAGWIYGPSYLPTGEPLYNPGSAANAGSYVDAQMTSLIGQTITGPLSSESAALTTYAKYVSEQDPVIFGPTSVGTYGGYAATLIDKKLARILGQRPGIPPAAVLVLHQVMRHSLTRGGMMDPAA